MSFTLDYSVDVPSPLDLTFKVLTGKEYTHHVLDLYGMLAWYKPGQPGERNGHPIFNFQFAERVPVLFGLTSTDVVLTAEQEVRPEEKMLVYRSRSSMVKVVKTRSFHATDNPQTTRVKEHLLVTCPKLLKCVVEPAARDAHRFHMSNYHKLFKEGALPVPVHLAD
ncbi:hypothetical protein DUNSADRAFT_9663 [Dunaliella salina]|uniref:Uncharacterized protein n=1 Tax=Dunaliella salina TaxID=3046 RepID=A0ABQ7GGZ0_DUNSA|nr:hypothetical protein DUNSADRAFT_9663 [Dunaliella salina]|eukprot:KAF5833868.1 hypothetical protein DUNSADRAFT_9663 [Dunaliella salina]